MLFSIGNIGEKRRRGRKSPKFGFPDSQERKKCQGDHEKSERTGPMSGNPADMQNETVSAYGLKVEGSLAFWNFSEEFLSGT